MHLFDFSCTSVSEIWALGDILCDPLKTIDKPADSLHCIVSPVHTVCITVFYLFTQCIALCFTCSHSMHCSVLPVHTFCVILCFTCSYSLHYTVFYPFIQSALHCVFLFIVCIVFYLFIQSALHCVLPVHTVCITLFYLFIQSALCCILPVHTICIVLCFTCSYSLHYIVFYQFIQICCCNGDWPSHSGIRKRMREVVFLTERFLSDGNTTQLCA